QFELDSLRNFRIAFGKRRRVKILVGRINLVACRHGLSVLAAWSSARPHVARCPLPSRAEVIHPAHDRYQPNPQELAIFQRITPLYLGIKRSSPQAVKALWRPEWPAGRAHHGRKCPRGTAPRRRRPTRPLRKPSAAAPVFRGERSS